MQIQTGPRREPALARHTWTHLLVYSQSTEMLIGSRDVEGFPQQLKTGTIFYRARFLGEQIHYSPRD
jgi:hypothetical protein